MRVQMKSLMVLHERESIHEKQNLKSTTALMKIPNSLFSKTNAVKATRRRLT